MLTLGYHLINRDMNTETLRAHALTNDPDDDWQALVQTAEYPELVVLCAMYYTLPDGFPDQEFDGWDFYEEYFVSGLIRNGKLHGTLTCYRLDEDEEVVKLSDTQYKDGVRDGYETLYNIPFGQINYTRRYVNGEQLADSYICKEGSLNYGK